MKYVRVRALAVTGLVLWTFLALALYCFPAPANRAEQPYSWYAPDRAAKVATLIPGRKVTMPPPDVFLADWTRQQVSAWEKTHGPLAPEEAYRTYSQAEPTDEELASLPDHISPFARVVAGHTTAQRAENALVSYCPLCGRTAELHAVGVKRDDAGHVVTVCCGQDLTPNSTVELAHLDDTVKQVPAYTFTDKDGVTWQLFPETRLDYDRWVEAGKTAVEFLDRYRDTGDPRYVHKLAALLDRVADIYYGLPLAYANEIATGSDGKPLTRAEWEGAPRPKLRGSLFGRAPLNEFAWNRRTPLFERGWLFFSRELIWVEPFARVRHHPAFRYYSTRRYGDPDALDRKIMKKLMGELALVFKSFALTSDYQDGSYDELLTLAILVQDRFLFNFAAGHQECVLYNHHYHDGMNGEGSAEYMGYGASFCAYMGNPKAWLEFDPDFVKEHPFLGPASSQLQKLRTVRGLPLEFGDLTIRPFNEREFLTDPEKVRANEKMPSSNWPGYGIGILRVGGHGQRQEVFMTYDRVSLHGAADKLGIECWVDGVPVMRQGGYSQRWIQARLDESLPEIQALLRMPYPRPIFETAARPDSSFNGWDWTHSALAQNTVTVNELSTGPGWDDREGFGDLITFKGGEAPGTPGARFQVLDCEDLHSFTRMGVPVSEFRRTLLAVEGPDGRPYVVDILRLEGGRRHALYQSAWGDPVEENLPPPVAEEPHLAAYLDKLPPGQRPESIPSRGNYEHIRGVKVLGAAPPVWGITWSTDYAAYAPFDASGQPRPRPLPDAVGRVRLRLVGVRREDHTTLLHAKGPWVARLSQPLPGGGSVHKNLGFHDAWDYLVESRIAPAGQGGEPLKSTYLHILEGFREGEASVIRSVTPLSAAPGASLPEGAVALKLALAVGHTDTILFQPRPGKLHLQDGLVTDAQYALVRRDAKGAVTEAHMVRGTKLSCGRFALAAPGDFRGKIVDLIGDLTGTRKASALIIRPDGPWPLGTALAGRQIAIQVITQHSESYTVDRVRELPGGLLRVDLANYAPFSTGWYQVSSLDAEKPNRLLSSRQLWAGINTTWWWGCKAWFPERGRTYTIRQTHSDRITMDIAEKVDLKAEGIQPGDWFVIYAIQPGLAVSVPDIRTWCQAPRTPARKAKQ